MVKMTFAALLVLVFTFGVWTEAQAQNGDEWEDRRGAARFGELDWLIGEWQGYGVFAEGRNQIHKSYGYEVGGMFLVERTLDMFPTETPSTDYEIHQDFMVVYRDTLGGGLLAKTFFIEAFVASSELTVAEGGDVFVIESTRIENGSPGMRTRYTIRRQWPDDFTGTFELAFDGGEFTVFEELTLRRIY